MSESVSGGEREAIDEFGETSDAEEITAPTPTGDYDIDSALELVIATFPSEESAGEAFKVIKEAERQRLILVVDAAVVNCDEDNKLHVKDEQDWPGHVGALLGAGIGAILGTIGGPLGVLAGGAAGAAIGGAAAGDSDAGMSDQRLMEFANSLKPGTAMVIVAVAHLWSGTTASLLAEAGGEIQTILLTDDIARQLNLPQAGQ